MLNPIEVPVAGVLIIGLVVVRREPGAPGGVRGGRGLVDHRRRGAGLRVSIILAAVPHLARTLLGVVVGFGIVAMLVGGIIGAANGERHFEHHETEHDSYDTTVTTMAGNPQTGVVTTTTTEAGG